MVLSEEEKKEHRRQASAKYYQKVKKNKEKLQRRRARSVYSVAKTYIKTKATKTELDELRDLIAERAIYLRKLKNAKKDIYNDR